MLSTNQNLTASFLLKALFRKIGSRRHAWLAERPNSAAKKPETVPVWFPRRHQVERGAWEATKSPTARSLIFALPDNADEPVTSWKDDAIGQEASDILKRALNSKEPTEWNRFLFGPKSLIGDDFRADHAFRRYRNEQPIELYLRELLNQAVFRCTWDDGVFARPLGPLLKVAFSYPITWTKDQRAAFIRHLQNALENSAFAELLPAGGAAGVVREEYALDEATAAFLGFVYERYAGLNGEHLMQMLQPFDPRPEAETTFPKKANVLVFDCGEGTTDVVWLELCDPGGNKPVESTALRHFAMDRAGLEVTRRLAERIKNSLYERNPSLKELLRTNLKDPGIADGLLPQTTGATGGNTTIKAHRRGLAINLFLEADDLKLKLAADPPRLNLAEVRWSQTPITRYLPGADLTLPRIVLDDLTKIVQDVFAPASDQLQRWFVQGMPRLDMVLFSGRSCQLPELRSMILAAIPDAKRPYWVDTVEPKTIRLDISDEASPLGEKSKTVVCTGLVLNRWNADASDGKTLRCKPIDERRRTRAIGQMATNIANEPLQHFSNGPLLVEPDNEPINPTKAIGPVRITNAESAGFFIGVNFGGPGQPGRQVDPVRPLCRVEMQGGHSGLFDELQFFFIQTSAAQIRLGGVRVIKSGAAHKDVRVTTQDLAAEIKIGPLTIRRKIRRLRSGQRFPHQRTNSSKT